VAARGAAAQAVSFSEVGERACLGAAARAHPRRTPQSKGVATSAFAPGGVAPAARPGWRAPGENFPRMGCGSNARASEAALERRRIQAPAFVQHLENRLRRPGGNFESVGTSP